MKIQTWLQMYSSRKQFNICLSSAILSLFVVLRGAVPHPHPYYFHFASPPNYHSFNYKNMFKTSLTFHNYLEEEWSGNGPIIVSMPVT